MDEDIRQSLSGEYAALAQTGQVMAAAAGYLGDLHLATTRLGDAIDHAGLPGRDWRSADAELSLLAETLPPLTVDELITALTDLSVIQGPVWLKGGDAELEQFHEEVATLYAVVHPLRTVAHKLRMTPGSATGGLPIERAFANARIGAPLDRVASLLEKLEAMRRFMAPIPPEQWERSDRLDDEDAASTTYPPPLDEALLGAGSGSTGSRLRDYAAKAGADISPPPLKPHARGFRAPAQQWRLIAVLAVVLVGASAAFLIIRHPFGPTAHVATPTPTPPALVASPAALVFTCSTRVAVPFTLHNGSAAPITWQAQAPTTLSLAPARGTLTAGQTITVQAKLTSIHALGGTITLTAGAQTASVPYTTPCH